MSAILEANRRVALAYLHFAFSMKMDSAIALLAEEATWWTNGDPARFRIAGDKDHEQSIRMLAKMSKVLPDGMRYKVLGTTAEGDRVAIELEAEGTWHDGRPYRNNYHFLIRVFNGKVARIHEYLDLTQIPA